MNNTLRIETNTRLSATALHCFTQADSQIVVGRSVLERLARRRKLLETHVNSSPDPVYGATTGLGAMKTHRVLPESASTFNGRMLQDHAAGYGPRLDMDTSRLMMGIRIVELCQGGSGISPESFDFFVECYNRGLVPVVPQFGSVGEADITILAHMARMVLGNGRVWRVGKTEDAQTALTRVGLTPISLGIRDGLALIGGNSYTFSLMIQACHEWKQVRKFSILAVALSWIAWRANTSSLRPDVVTAIDDTAGTVAQQVLGWIGDTKIQPRHVQDPLSWRCVPQVYAAMDITEQRMEDGVVHGIHTPRDNPLVLDTGEIISNGNFDITKFSVEMDGLRNALVRVMALHTQRVAKLLNHHYSDLSPGLAHIYGDAGLGLFDFNVSVLMTEAVDLAQSPLIQFGEVAEGVEDYGSLATIGAQRVLKLIALWRTLISIELICAMRAINLQHITIGNALQKAVASIDRIQADAQQSPYEKIQDVETWMKNTVDIR